MNYSKLVHSTRSACVVLRRQAARPNSRGFKNELGGLRLTNRTSLTSRLFDFYLGLAVDRL